MEILFTQTVFLARISCRVHTSFHLYKNSVKNYQFKKKHISRSTKKKVMRTKNVRKTNSYVTKEKKTSNEVTKLSRS